MYDVHCIDWVAIIAIWHVLYSAGIWLKRKSQSYCYSPYWSIAKNGSSQTVIQPPILFPEIMLHGYTWINYSIWFRHFGLWHGTQKKLFKIILCVLCIQLRINVISSVRTYKKGRSCDNTTIISWWPAGMLTVWCDWRASLHSRPTFTTN